MRSWWAVAVLAVVAHCGGTSVRREDAGDGDGSEDGGTSGTLGARGGTGGTAGIDVPTGGRGGSGSTTPAGGRVSGGGTGGTIGASAGDGGDGAVSGAAGSDGGSAGEPSCDEDLVPSTCSPEDTCEILECGAPWSFFDARHCRRTECTQTGTCSAGERCVPAPVLGKYDDSCSYGWDSCEHDAEGTCQCIYYEECAPLALCIPEDEFPPSRDCPIEDPMDCFGLSRAVAALEAYRDGTQFFFPYDPPPALAASVEACAERLATALQSECD